ncbi:hypothetical protein DFJ77DRAFT_440290 [Powellomyces hirtus]|nr:hypothetical protein DFJ77DRAFT_440290 [Powellomyces hirtus]
MTLQISDYLDSYLQLCDERNVFTVPSLRRSLQNAVDGGGQVPDAFHLSGTQSELSLTRLNDAYVDILLKPLVACGVVLRELDLSCNEIADAGAMQIAAFLKDDVVLETLNLRSNTIQPPGIIALARSLHINEHLRILNLGGNTIGSSGGLELANMLQLNSTLTTLLLDSANLPTPGLIALSTVLCNNTTLTTLDISNNYSTPFSRVATADFAAHFTKMLECNFNLVDIAARKLRMDDVDAKDRWARAIALNLRITHLDLTA